ncbi:unnamed protein product [Tuber aestivum]|uniref:Uncharacterized protein n=1 Tax=Tuber aestivum TaxID=59557 RepID=A0A292PUI9_9PEZI|nr:unnamed protein product [Tuber aestivum]
MVPAMRDLERTSNHKCNYPWTFFNHAEFSQEFRERTQAETKAECRYEVISKDHWAIPSWTNNDLMAESAKLLEEKKVHYSRLKSYHQMCRWNSERFHDHPALKDIRRYWRVEPKVEYLLLRCGLRRVQVHGPQQQTYGFVIKICDPPESIETLWPHTLEFLAENPDYLHPKYAMAWLTDSKNRPDHQKSRYWTCHFRSNFEIADMNLWRSKKYRDYFDHLDRPGGFFYERWGDAPVRSIALGLIEDKNRIHWFRDIVTNTYHT